MRIESPYAKRKSYFDKTQNEKPKYFFVYEGSHTEVQYFNGIIDNRIKIGINPIIELIPLLRNISHKHEGDPYKILQYLDEQLDENKTIKFFIEQSIDYFCENNQTINCHKLKEPLMEHIGKYYKLEQNINDINKNDLVKTIIEYMNENHDIVDCIENLEKYLSTQEIYYNDEVDKICIIIDRNIHKKEKGNKRFDYKKYLQKCFDKNYYPFVSNPDFEIWLLMHSDKIFEYNKDELLVNEKNNKGKRYLENILFDIFDGYEKGKIKFEKFLPLIEQAIENEKNFCENVEDLENKLGSNIGILINKLITHNTNNQ